MSLKRSMLKAMGIEDEKIEQIMEAHVETVDALKEQRDAYKADAEKLADVQKQLDKATKDLEASGKDTYKVKYEAIKEEFDSFKKEQTAKEARAAKESAYRELLKAAGISEKRIAAILKVSDIDSVELDENGAIKDANKLTESIKAEWADFIPTTTTRGAQTATPPANTGSGMTREQISGIKDRAERRAAIAANLDMFNQKGVQNGS